MHIYTLDRWRHNHRFHGVDRGSERSTRRVMWLTVGMMAVEIAGGMVFGSMALLADGWHMGTHAVALGIAAAAYRYARLHADSPHFSFGTGKVGDLGGFASAVVLSVVALLMAVESIQRLISPAAIHFNQAVLVAVVGLAVNVVSALLLQDRDHAGHDHDHHHDHNLRAAYVHVLADALTSVLAIIALLAGKFFGWVWMDPLMGMVGAAIITRWSWGLLRDTGRVLLDRDVDPALVAEMVGRVEADADNRVSDIHVWRVGGRSLSVILSVVTHEPRPPDHYKRLLTTYPDVEHVTVEVIACEGESCLTRKPHGS
jgi:cation diffusion facilitator family transporter